MTEIMAREALAYWWGVLGGLLPPQKFHAKKIKEKDKEKEKKKKGEKGKK